MGALNRSTDTIVNSEGISETSESHRYYTPCVDEKPDPIVAKLATRTSIFSGACEFACVCMWVCMCV